MGETQLKYMREYLAEQILRETSAISRKLLMIFEVLS